MKKTLLLLVILLCLFMLFACGTSMVSNYPIADNTVDTSEYDSPWHYRAHDLLSNTETEITQSAEQLADVDEDDKITSTDVLIIFRHIYAPDIYSLGETTGSTYKLGDVNKDGHVSNLDILKIFKYIFNPELYPLDCDNSTTTAVYTVTFVPMNEQTSFTQQISRGEKATRPADPVVEFGYKFGGWYYTENGISVKWDFDTDIVTQDITLFAQVEYATYELPIVNINTNGAGIYSKEDYTTMTFSIENCDDELANVTGGIRLRGNSTMQYDKKPYRIKFDEKHSLFGLTKAKSWVLLADYLDPSALHNYTALSLANELEGFAFTPTPHKVNVYLNGEYIGLYTLCEQVQENKGRINIEVDINPEWTELKQFNFFVEMDASVAADSTAKLNETYFYIEKYNRYFDLKYPEKDQFVSEEQFRSFFTQLQEYTLDMLDAFAEADYDKIQQEVNINSFVDYFIVDTIMGEHDHGQKSFNMYYTNTSDNPEENEKLNFGPVWDYDWSLNTDWSGVPNNQFDINLEIFYLESDYNPNPYYTVINEIPELYDLVKERYILYAKNPLGNYIENLDAITESISESVALNHILWYSSLDEDLSNDNIAFLKSYLIARKAQLDELWDN